MGKVLRPTNSLHTACKAEYEANVELNLLKDLFIIPIEGYNIAAIFTHKFSKEEK